VLKKRSTKSGQQGRLEPYNNDEKKKHAGKKTEATATRVPKNEPVCR